MQQDTPISGQSSGLPDDDQPSIQSVNLTKPNTLLSESYRNHCLVYALEGELCIGEVFHLEEKVAYCESLDLINAQQHCRQIVDARLVLEATENKGNLPDIASIAAAIRSVGSFSDPVFKALLSRHLNAKNQPIAINDLITTAGLHSSTELVFKYAALARLIADALGYLPPTQASGQDPYLAMMIHTEEAAVQDSRGLTSDLTPTLSLKPAIFQALAQISPV